MPKTLAFIHTIPALVEFFDGRAREAMPEVNRLHTLDEPLLARIRNRGGLSPDDSQRLSTHVATAAEAGANAVLVTCSTLSPCVDEVRSAAAIPVLKIDEAMFTEAVQRGNRIAILATNSATIGPTRDGILAAARTAGRSPGLIEIVIAPAFEALLAGRREEHDQLLATVTAEVAPQADILVYAQATMAAALPAVDPALHNRILTSPQTALKSAAALLTT